ncbi:putative reverse transcriptase zinc-binding domain-containing protein [Medicago truncatula]|uniref:Putative reverse transcriptase zinc-binding domain-containing protein n=1 Tax=Medicago truncatula TaxID=3880 RepID=A0A396H2U1_MEDTR|nr:putative reverse transcriptase zinc-binding domain-containing protein [Medicago truncatula]
MGRLGWTVDGRAWEWTRRLFVWEEECVRECCILLNNFVLQDNVNDKWRWLLDPVNGYSVKVFYRYITSTGHISDRSLVDDVWHKHIPSKVSLFVWRLLRNRLPTKDNLVHRGVLLATNAACVCGCVDSESTTHLFLHCNVFCSLWSLVRNWLGIPSMSSGELRTHFIQFAKMVGMPRVSHLYFRLIFG